MFQTGPLKSFPSGAQLASGRLEAQGSAQVLIRRVSLEREYHSQLFVKEEGAAVGWEQMVVTWQPENLCSGGASPPVSAG